VQKRTDDVVERKRRAKNAQVSGRTRG